MTDVRSCHCLQGAPPVLDDTALVGRAVKNDRVSPRERTRGCDTLPTDTSGEPVNVVERDIEDTDDDTRAVDEALTPTANRAKEQYIEELNRKRDEIERKVADGN
jgi:hypothetical protein